MIEKWDVNKYKEIWTFDSELWSVGHSPAHLNKSMKPMNELLTDLLSALGLAWWVEITTDSPRCLYYFGPFLSPKEAKAKQWGYVEDLKTEGAQNIVVKVKRCKPTDLTIYDEEAGQGVSKTQISGILSGQF